MSNRGRFGPPVARLLVLRILCAQLTMVLLAAGCSSPGEKTAQPVAPAPAIVPVALPDLSRADEGVQAQARDRHAALLEKMKAGAGGAELGAAYGELGMILHAAEYFDSAEPSYLNAQTLMPGDARWPYYLGHLYTSKGEIPKAEAAFKRTLDIEPEDVPALIRLGRLHLDRGEAAMAEPLFARARASAPRSVAVLAGLGQAALATRQYERAVELLEEGLKISPGSLSLHSPLANAYRALGRTDQAEAHLKKWRNTDLPVADPRKEQLDTLLQSGLSFALRGERALDAKDWKGAEALFRQGLAVSPPDSLMRRSLHHKLGTALWMTGDERGAVEQFKEVVRMAPSAAVADEPTARANYSLGIVMASSGQTEQAITYLSDAVKYQPNYSEAHLALGDGLRRTGRFADALTHYQEVVRLNPRAAPARFGFAMALVRLRRYMEARDWLTQSIAIMPDRPELTHALARVLAAAPDDRVRDGRRALSLTEQLMANEKTTEIGETLAMSLAELGDFRQATAVQRDVLVAAQRAGLTAAAARMRQNLKLYQGGRPCRTPWTDDDPVHQPGPPS